MIWLLLQFRPKKIPSLLLLITLFLIRFPVAPADTGPPIILALSSPIASKPLAKMLFSSMVLPVLAVIPMPYKLLLLIVLPWIVFPEPRATAIPLALPRTVLPIIWHPVLSYINTPASKGSEPEF
ncbi:MAG: hypothetical protein WCY64_00985 [Candidatus Cloacimonadaceae bacterium]